MSVRDPSKQVQQMSVDWPMIAALMGGTTAMRLAGVKLLPQWPNEDDDAYKIRLLVATLFPAFKRTIEVLSGKPFSKPLSFGEDVPDRVREWCEDADLQGRNLHAFAGAVCAEAIAYGSSGILIDFPQVVGQDEPADGDDPKPSPIRTVAQEKAAGVRPYMIQVHPQNILGWKSERQNGADVLTQLRLLEVATEEDGDFNEVEIEQVRVLYIGRWEIWRESDQVDASGKRKWVVVDQGTTTFPRIPFILVYGNRTGFMTATPPLVEMGHMNVKHWQSQSDQDNLLHTARVPILCVAGVDDDKFKLSIGAGCAVKLPRDATMEWVEHTGAAITAGRTSILDLEDQMRQAGAELLVIKPGHVTEAQTIADNEQGMCALQRITNDLEDSLDAALQVMAEWVGEPQGGHVTVYKDFGSATLAEASALLLLQSAQAGKISDETYFEELQRRGVVKPDAKWADEKGRIDSQGPVLGVMSANLPVEDPAGNGGGSGGGSAGTGDNSGGGGNS